MQKNKNISSSKIYSHSINIFDMYTEYRFFKFSCIRCKLKNKCEVKDFTNCLVANDTEKLLQPYVIGKNSSFASDDFYVHNHTFRIADKIKLTIKNITVRYQRQI